MDPLNPSPIPSGSLPAKTQSLTIVLDDPRSIALLIEQLLIRANLSEAELARRLGIKRASLNQYRSLRRKRPSLAWFARLVETCGGRIILEYPTKRLEE
jgi:hypothetical protein